MNDISSDALQALRGQGDKAEVATDHGPFDCRYEIRGSLRAVLAEIEAIFFTYHPMGYGTHVVSMRMDDFGKYVAKVTRSQSCD